MESEAPAMDDALSAFERTRPRLFGIAYRMLGSAAEAEDVVRCYSSNGASTSKSTVDTAL